MSEFGWLKHATPANVREFLDHVESDVFTGKVKNRFIINEPCSSYEEVIKDFFAQILQLLPERQPLSPSGPSRCTLPSRQ